MHKNAIFGDLSYGYPMGMVWVSYGAHSHFFLIWLIFDSAWSQKIRGAVGVSDGRAGNSIALKWTNVFLTQDITMVNYFLSYFTVPFLKDTSHTSPVAVFITKQCSIESLLPFIN